MLNDFRIPEFPRFIHMGVLIDHKTFEPKLRLAGRRPFPVRKWFAKSQLYFKEIEPWHLPEKAADYPSFYLPSTHPWLCILSLTTDVAWKNMHYDLLKTLDRINYCLFP